MKRTLICPKCEGRVLLHVDEVKTTTMTPGLSATLAPLPVVATASMWRGVSTVGSFEAFICRGCGYSELYAVAPERIQSDEKRGVQVIDNEPKAGLR